ncbi:MAG: hypothetical protein QF815_01110 [Candidatus Peribacteraceae bacterium]|nr:hypothetical protein [Candidatus Peribacteraceae bacterium]
MKKQSVDLAEHQSTHLEKKMIKEEESSLRREGLRHLRTHSSVSI